MLAGILAGITWAVETLLLGGAVALPVFSRDLEAAFLAPFVCAFFHDTHGDRQTAHPVLLRGIV